ncbi:histidine phosphatase family protein [bacterium]|nr:histidine phosphatase family protein [bacterium]
MSKVVLVRPGCTDFDEQKRIQGSLELPLNDRGQSQLTKVIDALRTLPVEAVLTGPCEPCASVAAQIASSLDLKLKERDDLRNVDQGLWQGLCIDEVRRKFPSVFRQWEDAPETVCPPNGEMTTDAVERLAAVLKKPLRKYDCFAVVASEPLASLISFTLRGEEPDDLCGSLFGCCDDNLVEVIETTGTNGHRVGVSHLIPLAASVKAGSGDDSSDE